MPTTSFEHIQVSRWTPAHVSQWLASLGAEPTVLAAVAREKINGKIVHLMDSDAWSEIGLTPLMRSRARASLEARGGPSAAFESARLNGCIRLGVAINVLSISKVETVDQQFDAEFVLRCRTLNAKDLLTVGHEPVEPDNWEPRLRFLNLLETKKWSMHSKLDDDGELTLKYTVAGTFSEKFELGAFPFDVQALSLVLSSSIPFRTPDGTHVLRLEPMPNTFGVVQLSNFSASNVFDLAGHVAFGEPTHTDAADSTTGTVRPILRISMLARRRGGYFVWNVILPMLVIDGLSLGAFAIPASDVADRLSVSGTMLLTAVAFKLQVGSDLPNLAYLTMIDIVVLVSFASVALVAIENVLLAYAGEMGEAADALMMYVLAVGFVARCAGWLVVCSRRQVQSMHALQVFDDGKRIMREGHKSRAYERLLDSIEHEDQNLFGRSTSKQKHLLDA